MANEMGIIAAHSQVAPVNLLGMFRDLGIQFYENYNFGPESGWIERNGNSYSVTVNAFEPEVRQRFTAAHELAHYLLHRDLLDGGRMNRHTDQLYDGPQPGGAGIDRYHEVQANKLAAEIIMPAGLVRREFLHNPDLAHLANLFRVSRAAMEIRLRTLGLA